MLNTTAPHQPPALQAAGGESRKSSEGKIFISSSQRSIFHVFYLSQNLRQLLQRPRRSKTQRYSFKDLYKESNSVWTLYGFLIYFLLFKKLKHHRQDGALEPRRKYRIWVSCYKQRILYLKQQIRHFCRRGLFKLTLMASFFSPAALDLQINAGNPYRRIMMLFVSPEKFLFHFFSR